MAVTRFSLTFRNGEVREVESRPIHQVRAEAVTGGTGGSLTYVYATLWAADTGGRGDRKAFEKWLENFEDFDRVDTDDPEADADPPGQGEASPD